MAKEKKDNLTEPTKRKRRFGDRYDGWRIRGKNEGLFFSLIPYIMRTRLDSQCFFDELIDLEAVNKLINQLRRDGKKDIRIYHFVVAAIVRTISQRPRMNRFVAGHKIYARKDVCVAMAIKRNLTDDGAETTIKPTFSRKDTLFDVVEKMNNDFTLAAASEAETDVDGFVKILQKMPGFLKQFIVFLARNLDKIGLLPKFIHEISPFHSSIFLTDVGSLGIASVYHHLYEFGTTSVFIGMGKKETKLAIDREGHVKEKKYINFRLVVDERICDGYYYATTIKTFRRLMLHPESLLTPPENICEDL